MTLYEFPDRPDEATRRAVCAWLEQHGIDPNRVAVPGWIETDPHTRRISYSGYAFDDVKGRSVPRLTEDGDDVVRLNLSHQLESPPLPFPEVTS